MLVWILKDTQVKKKPEKQKTTALLRKFYKTITLFKRKFELECCFFYASNQSTETRCSKDDRRNHDGI